MLKLDSIQTKYGSIYALKGIDLVLNQCEILTIIGANGAGKSTTLKYNIRYSAVYLWSYRI